MRTVLGISTVLGIIGVVAAFALFWLAEENVLKSFLPRLDRGVIQTLIYLKLSVAGHLTIFLTRTRGPFWSIAPARILWIAVLGTQIIATLIAYLGLGLMDPLPWKWILFVWIYALCWALLNDRVKLLAYWVLDHTEVGKSAKAKALDQSEAKVAAGQGVKAESRTDRTPQIAARAYELYQDRLHGRSQEDQDWLEAERETPKPETKPKEV
jgi:H+-transporting ATPase